MIEKIIQGLWSSSRGVIDIMKLKLDTKVTSGNKLPHSTTFKTSNSISANMPKLDGDILEWDFVAEDSAVRLNTGGSTREGAQPGMQDVPYAGKGKGGGSVKSQYINALTTWAQNKYGMDEYTAKRLAFSVAQSAVYRGQTVKATGWLDEAKKELDEEAKRAMDSVLTREINSMARTSLKYK